jgi:hypothetical protein
LHEKAVKLDDLIASLSDPEPPSGLPQLLRALWLAASGDWEGAHVIAQEQRGPAAAWVHAYLHRKEGDTANAAYWYDKAGRPAFVGDLDDEWEIITRSLLEG